MRTYLDKLSWRRSLCKKKVSFSNLWSKCSALTASWSPDVYWRLGASLGAQAPRRIDDSPVRRPRDPVVGPPLVPVAPGARHGRRQQQQQQQQHFSSISSSSWGWRRSNLLFLLLLPLVPLLLRRRLLLLLPAIASACARGFSRQRKPEIATRTLAR